MNRTKLLSLALALAAAGCSGGASQPPAVGAPAPGEANLATVTLRASFPSGAVDPSLVTTDTATIVVSWQPELAISTAAGSRSLTPGFPTATVRLPVGKYFFKAEARDATAALLETAGTAGKVIAGDNAVSISFLTGKWTFVDGGGAAFPVELVASTADASTTLKVAGFTLTPRYFAPAPSALDPTIPLQYAEYDQTWQTNDTTNPNKDGTQLRLVTQFGGGAWNSSVLDGGDWNITRACASSGGGGTCSNGPGNVGDRSFRIAGDFGQSAQSMNHPTQNLLPMYFVPEIRGYTSRIVSGATLAGYLLEWAVVGYGAPVVMENLVPTANAPIPPASVSARSFVPGLVVHMPQEILLCRAGYNGNPSPTAATGNWDFSKTCCDASGCNPCGTCDVRDGGGNFLYATCGYLPAGGDPGNCNWGLVAATGDRGEWCDNWNWSFNRCDPGGNGIVEPDEFHDLNGDGVISTGSFYYRHGLDQSATLDGWVTPFTAKGAQLGQSVGITIN